MFAAPINKPATNILIGLSLLCSLAGADVLARWRAALREPVVIGFLVWLGVLFASALHAWMGRGEPVFRDTSIWGCVYPALIASLLMAVLGFAAFLRMGRGRWYRGVLPGVGKALILFAAIGLSGALGTAIVVVIGVIAGVAA